MAFNNGFIGRAARNASFNFIPEESEEEFRKNLKYQPSDWVYRTKTLDYTFNDNGHRCKNIEDVDLDNYILFAGCSHAEAVGLALEDSYPYLLSEQLGCDYYNLAVGGSGIDTMMHNLAIWLAKVDKKPKYLVVQWPEPTRYTILSLCKQFFNYFNPSSLVDDHIKFALLGDSLGFFDTRKAMCEALVNSITPNVMNVGFSFMGENIPGMDATLSKCDLARDLSHTGITSHQRVTDKLKQAIEAKADAKTQ